MKKLIPFFIIPFCLLVFFSKAQGNQSLDDERIIKEKRKIAPFENLVIVGGPNIFVHHSDRPFLEIKGTKSLVKEAEVRVVSNSLRISIYGDFPEDAKMDIHVFTPVLKSVQQSGGGKVEILKGFSRIDKFKCTIKGGGAVDISALPVNILNATIEGGGEILSEVANLLDGKITGGGEILYEGNPKVESDIVGGGIIKRK